MTRDKPLPWRWIAWTTVLALVTTFTLLPLSAGLPEGPRIPHFDKLVHACAWAAVCALTFWALIRVWARQRAAIAAVSFGVAHGLAIELLQLAVPGRSADPWDLLADAVGSLLGVAFLLWRTAGHARPDQARS